MRTVKFRGRESDDNWCYGSLIQYKSGEVAIANFERYGNECSTMSRTNVDPATVGQLTGFHDRNGKEIYEGDIIDVHIPCNSIGKEEHRTRVVVWNEKCARFEFQNKRGDCIADSVGAKYNVVYYEVVGNIHDNPELLGEGGHDD